MAYFNGFPATYPQMYQPTQYQQNNQQGGKIWVQGEAGAKSYLVAPNSTVDLWDSENQTIYIKSADAAGLPSIKVLDYTIRETPKNPSNSFSPDQGGKSQEYATKAEIEALNNELRSLKSKIEKLTKRSDEDE